MKTKPSLTKNGATVAVLTVSKRTGWEEVARQSILSQTRKPDQWIIVSENADAYNSLKDIATIIQAPHKKRFSNLNASENEGLRHITADYVVLYQDFIKLEPDTIKKLLDSAETTGGLITTATINDDGTMDGRYTGTDGIRRCEPAEWEGNVAIAPMKMYRELGGYDETYDDGWAWDNCGISERARMLGYKCYIDESIKPQLLYHKKEPAENLNGDRHALTMEKITRGELPIKVNYL